MGKGDKKTRRGKIILGSYGVTRPKKTAGKGTATASVKEVNEPVKPKAKPKPTKKAKEE